MCPGPERAEGQGGSSMLRIGGTASPGHITIFRGLKTHFQQQGIALDWVLYADYDALVEAFATREIDLAWNGPLSYVHIKQRLNDPCRVVAMRDVDVNFSTQLFPETTRLRSAARFGRLYLCRGARAESAVG